MTPVEGQPGLWRTRTGHIINTANMIDFCDGVRLGDGRHYAHSMIAQSFVTHCYIETDKPVMISARFRVSAMGELMRDWTMVRGIFEKKLNAPFLVMPYMTVEIELNEPVHGYLYIGGLNRRAE